MWALHRSSSVLRPSSTRCGSDRRNTLRATFGRRALARVPEALLHEQAPLDFQRPRRAAPRGDARHSCLSGSCDDRLVANPHAGEPIHGLSKRHGPTHRAICRQSCVQGVSCRSGKPSASKNPGVLDFFASWSSSRSAGHVSVRMRHGNVGRVRRQSFGGLRTRKRQSCKGHRFRSPSSRCLCWAVDLAKGAPGRKASIHHRRRPGTRA